VPRRRLHHPGLGERDKQRLIRRLAAPQRAAALGAVAGALALSVTALGAIGIWPEVGKGPAAQGGFRITGSAEGLLPGAPGRLFATVRNPYGWPIRVTTISVTAHDAGACRAANLRTARLRRPVVVAARASRRLVLAISLAADAPDACQGARFRLSFSARAVKA
jgi:hypothetical protein